MDSLKYFLIASIFFIGVNAQCNPNPCRNDASCVVEGPHAVCRCQGGYYGHRCQFKIDCVDSPCENGAQCKEANGVSWCECGPNFDGELCELDCSATAPQPCSKPCGIGLRHVGSVCGEEFGDRVEACCNGPCGVHNGNPAGTVKCRDFPPYSNNF